MVKVGKQKIREGNSKSPRTGERRANADPVERIAVWLAAASDKEQGDFFEMFGKELIRICGSYSQAEMQCAYANDHLSEEVKQLFKMLGYEKND